MTLAADELLTVRDFLRYAVSRFEAAELAYGHGTDNAFDEAAFIVLEGLHLPIDRLDPFLEARLLAPERARLADFIEARVETRRPAAYLLNKAYMHGLPFYVDERVLVPRSFIGEILFSDAFAGDAPLVEEPVTRVLDLCTGSGCLAVLAARVFPEASIDAVDLSRDALAVARINVERSDAADRISLFQGDLFAPLGDAHYDLIITNPPYVDAAGMAVLPKEYRHEPAMALAAGDDGLDLVRRILAGAAAHLRPGGGLVCEVGRGRRSLEAAYPDMPFLWLDTEGSAGEVFFLAAEDLG